jgi:predicted site-specific integrase-resolvase
MSTESDLIGSTEAFKLLGIDRSTLLRWREAGLLTEVHRLEGPNGAYLFRRADVEKLAAERAAKVAS